jgi:hypothetical protein
VQAGKSGLKKLLVGDNISFIAGFNNFASASGQTANFYGSSQQQSYTIVENASF